MAFPLSVPTNIKLGIGVLEGSLDPVDPFRPLPRELVLNPVSSGTFEEAMAELTAVESD